MPGDRKFRFTQRPLDLHGVSHADVKDKVENYAICHQNDLPLKIITGDSEEMRRLVIKYLHAHKFKFLVGDKFNKGYIVIIG